MLLACSGGSGSNSWTVLNVCSNNEPVRVLGGTNCAPVDSVACG